MCWKLGLKTHLSHLPPAPLQAVATVPSQPSAAHLPRVRAPGALPRPACPASGGPLLLSQPTDKGQGDIEEWSLQLLTRDQGLSSAHHRPHCWYPRPGSWKLSEANTNLFPSGSGGALKVSRRYIHNQPSRTFGPGGKAEGIPECGGEVPLHCPAGWTRVAVVSTEMSLRAEFTSDLKTILLFLPSKGQNKIFHLLCCPKA